MTEYTFVGGSLPSLQMGYPPEITFIEFARLLKLNLHPHDLAKSRVMRRYWDLQNVRSFWKNEPIEQRGNYDIVELEEAIATEIGIPDYFFEFLQNHESVQERLFYFPELISTYYREEGKRATGFLKKYLNFEREWRLVLTGFRAKILGIDLAKELQFEDPDDELIIQMMAQKDSPTYEPPEKYEELKALFEEHIDSPLELQKALCQWRFAKYEEMGGIDPFSIDRILAYQARLVVAERWIELDEMKGLEKMTRLEGTV